MKKNGFTLIELLAVIIILAIVALIATPIVLNVVDEARTSAAKSEASMIVSGVTNYCAAAEMRHEVDSTKEDICADGVTATEVATMVDLGNASVTSVTYDATTNKVTALNISSNTKTVAYDGTTYTVQ